MSELRPHTMLPPASALRLPYPPPSSVFNVLPLHVSNAPPGLFRQALGSRCTRPSGLGLALLLLGMHAPPPYVSAPLSMPIPPGPRVRRSRCGHIIPMSERQPPTTTLICPAPDYPIHPSPCPSPQVPGSGAQATAAAGSLASRDDSSGFASDMSEPSLTATTAHPKPKRSLMKRMSMWGSGGASKAAGGPSGGSPDRPSFMVRGEIRRNGIHNNSLLGHVR